MLLMTPRPRPLCPTGFFCFVVVLHDVVVAFAASSLETRKYMHVCVCKCVSIYPMPLYEDSSICICCGESLNSVFNSQISEATYALADMPPDLI